VRGQVLSAARTRSASGSSPTGSTSGEEGGREGGFVLREVEQRDGVGELTRERMPRARAALGAVLAAAALVAPGVAWPTAPAGSNSSSPTWSSATTRGRAHGQRRSDRPRLGGVGRRFRHRRERSGRRRRLGRAGDADRPPGDRPLRRPAGRRAGLVDGDRQGHTRDVGPARPRQHQDRGGEVRPERSSDPGRCARRRLQPGGVGRLGGAALVLAVGGFLVMTRKTGGSATEPVGQRV